MIKINLLPPEIKSEIEETKKNSALFKALIKSQLLFIFVVLIFGGSYFFINLRVQGATKKLSEEENSIKVFGTLEDKSRKIAERIDTIRQIDAGINKWSSAVEEIQKIIPEGVYLTQIKVDSNTKVRNQVSGNAASKKEVAALREAMEKSEKFEYVDIETSITMMDPIKKVEVESFSLSFSLEKGALK